MTVDMDPEMWRRQQRTRKVLVGGVMAAMLAAALGASLYAERSKPRRIGPLASAALSAPRYPDPFLSMTPAGIDALGEEGLCKAMCRTHLQCFAFQHPDSAGDELERMLSFCDGSCKVGAITPHAPDPKRERMGRDCLKKLDCTLFEQCVFGAVVPPSLAPPSASVTTPPPAPTSRQESPPPTSCPQGMVPVPGGSFSMGSADPAQDAPVHLVKVGPFCIGRTEVTVAEYMQCESSGHCLPAEPYALFIGKAGDRGPEPRQDQFCNAMRAHRGRHPMNCVNALAAEKYCAWKGGRLPKEEEWELAARGWDGRLFPWGNDMDGECINTCGKERPGHADKLGPDVCRIVNGFPYTAVVGSHPKNVSPFGALDMVGSLEEWTLGDPCAYTTKTQMELHSPCYPNDRVVRGGGALPAVRRFRQNWQSKHPTLGFRCVHPGKK